MTHRWIGYLLAGIFLCATILAYQLGWNRGIHQAERPDPTVSVREADPPPLAPAVNMEPRADTSPDAGSQGSSSEPRTMSLSEKGYEAAQMDLAGVLRRIGAETDAAMGGEAAHENFIRGVFTYIARHLSPEDALRIYRDQGPTIRGPALRALVAEWASSHIGIATPPSSDPKLHQHMETSQNVARAAALETQGDRLGLEVELASFLAAFHPGKDLVNAWLDAFADHPGRSEMAAYLTGDIVQEDPDAVFSLAENWTEWEQQRFETAMLEHWATASPEQAWDWFLTRQDTIPADTASVILDRWALMDPRGVQELLESLGDVDQRQAAVQAVAAALARQSTSEAVAWADQLEDPREQHAAYQQVIAETPKGVGLVVSYQDGFPQIEAILPDGPLAGSGLEAGDLIVTVTQAGGAAQSLYGEGLLSAVEQLRGNAGSAVEIHVLRQNTVTGSIQEYAVSVTREQLLIEPQPPGVDEEAAE